MFGLKTFLILYVFNTCSALDASTYEQAKAITAQKNQRNEILYQRHNVAPDDFMYNFQLEGFNMTDANRKADILLEYQRLLKNTNQCPRKTFKSCLRESENYVSLQNRCQLPSAPCNPNEKYSQINGYCNNLRHPNNAINRVPYSRMLKAAYQDGISEIRRASDGQEFPNPRDIGNLFDKAEDFKSCDKILATIHLMFSQMLAHDTTRRVVTEMRGNNGNGIKCCADSYSGPLPPSETNPACIPVPYPKDDAFYAQRGVFCQSFVRMQPTLKTNCKIKYAPENTVSSYVDLNNIYGDSLEGAAKLRLHSGGLFRLDSENKLPFNDAGVSIAGDFQFVQNTGLITIHVMMYRFHNMIATALAKNNPSWTDDHLFFEARRINIACYQHLVYDEWLPLVLGEKLIRTHKLDCQGKCDKYIPKINPTTSMEYGIAFRWFHINIPTDLWLCDGTGKIIKKFPFSDTYLSFDLIKQNYTNFVRGLMKQPQRMNRVGYTDEYRNLFFKANYRGHVVGVDGLMLDIMRERDGGVAPYIDFYPMCLKKKIKSWKDLEPYFEKSHFKLLRYLYKTIKDIEFMVGILLEKRKDGGNLMGKIGGCVTAKQFYHFKHGDRFFYSHRNNPNPFSKDQLAEIKRWTFARLVCMTTDVGIVPKHGFVSVSPKNPYVDCSTLKPFNFAPFITAKKH